MTGCWHTENGNVQTAVIDPIIEKWLINVNEECQLNCIDWKTCIMNWKQPDAELQDYYTHYLYYYAHYFSWRTRIAVAVSTSYALPMYVHRFCVLQYAYGTSGMLPLLSEVPKLLCFFAIILHYITIIAIIFSIICIISNIKLAFWVGIHYRLQANSIIQHGGTLFEASSSGVDSTLDHKGAFSHHRAVDLNVNEECQLHCIDWNTCIMNWKQPDAELQDYYMHYLYYYAHYFSWRTRIAVAVSTSYALPMYVHRFCVLQYAYGTSRMLPLLSEVPKLFCLFAINLHYITIILQLFFQLYALYQM